VFLLCVEAGVLEDILWLATEVLLAQGADVLADVCVLLWFV
jgi:hypothetical protein